MYDRLQVHGSHQSEEDLPRFPFFGTSQQGKSNRKTRDDNPEVTGGGNKV